MKYSTKITTSIGIASWLCFGIYKYCSSQEIFWTDINSKVHLIGAKSINLSLTLAVIASIFSLIKLLKQRNKIDILNMLISFTILLYIICPVILHYLGSF